MSGSQRLLREAYSYPSYMRLTPDELSSIFESFINIFKSIFASIKLLTNTLILNMKVVVGTAKRDRVAIKEAFEKFEEQRRDYDRDTAKHLKYFKEYYVDSKIDNLGGFGPKVLAFAANPLLFASSEVSAATIKRGTGESSYEVPGGTGRGSSAPPPGGGAPGRVVRTTPRVHAALDFFGYEGGRLSEARQGPKISSEMMKEIETLNVSARKFVDAEKKNAEEILQQLGGRVAAIKKITDAQTFEDLLAAMKDAKEVGIKMFDSGIKTAHDKIREEFEKKQKENPTQFKQSVESMRERAPEIKDKDDLEAAMKFTFGIAKSQIQKQLIKVHSEFVNQAKSSMNLPIDSETTDQLSTSETGREYLSMLNNFERRLTLGGKQVEQKKV